MLERLFNASWYGSFAWTWLLWPLSLLVLFITKRKRNEYLTSPPNEFTVPVIVVGNITIGGTGKTPVVQALVRYLQSIGYRPGVVSRGYGGSHNQYPHLISVRDESKQVGDEPFMLFHSLNVPVVIDPVRKRGVEHLLKNDVNIVISDDGLQHYGLHRDYEICVIDGQRGLGNKQIMPVGPLREKLDRLNSVDYVLKSDLQQAANHFQIKPEKWVNVKSGKDLALDALEVNDQTMAIAGIGNPDKFNKSLQMLGINVSHKWFPDHYQFESKDFEGLPDQILMTEKDAVKVKPFASDDMWYLQITAVLPDAFKEHIKYYLNQWVKNHG